jgi:hypothetical protein
MKTQSLPYPLLPYFFWEGGGGRGGNGVGEGSGGGGRKTKKRPLARLLPHFFYLSAFLKCVNEPVR